MTLPSLLSTLLVVQLIVASTNGWEIPQIPAGRRAQYYLIHGDGGYKFGYDTNAGISAQASADAANEVQGGYTYSSPTGPVSLKYTAGIAGFVPVIDTGVIGYGANNALTNAASADTYQATAEEQPSGDASYSFDFSTKDQSRSEVSDATGNIHGSYSYLSTDGIQRKVDYEAGIGKGFVVKDGSNVESQSSSAAVASGFRSESNLGTDGGYSFSYDTGDHSRQETGSPNGNVQGSYSFSANDGVRRTVEYDASAEKGFNARGSHLPMPVEVVEQAPPAPAVPAPIIEAPVSTDVGVNAGSGVMMKAADIPVDGSYSFSYDAGDHSRDESSDTSGNVRGSFSFLANDGIKRRLDYEAGANTGFVARGDHLPVAVPVETVRSNVDSHQVAVAVEDASAVSSITDDGSYSFSYDASDHSRQESSDANGNVKGSYSFIAKDDGMNRRIDYEAGAATGFIAKGSHLPQQVPIPAIKGSSISSVESTYTKSNNVETAPAPNVPSEPASSGRLYDGSYSFSYDSSDQSRQESSDASGNVQGSFSFVAQDGINRRIDYEAGAEKGFIARGSHLPVPPPIPVALQPAVEEVVQTKAEQSSGVPTDTVAPQLEAVDGSYSFTYDAGDHSRQESSDNSGNIRGSYTFVAKDDGVSRRVDYESGAATGFLARGSHLPQPPLISEPSVPAALPTGQIDSTNDGSYSFSYDGGDHSRQESGDASGNVKGSFSFLTNGKSRRVEYEAGADTGFIARADHLPVAPPLPVFEPSVQSTSGAEVTAKQQGVSGASGDISYTYSSPQIISGHNYLIKTFFPPNVHQKFGYIYDSRQQSV